MSDKHSDDFAVRRALAMELKRIKFVPGGSKR